MTHILLPTSLNLKQLINDHPPSFSLKEDELAYMIYYLMLHTTSTEEKLSEPYVLLHSEILKGHLSNYNLYIRYLMDTGLVSCDGYFIPGVKSYGYRVSPLLFNDELVPYEVTIKRIARKVSAGYVCPKAKRKYSHLWKWFNTKLDFDRESSKVVLQQLHHKELQEAIDNIKKNLSPEARQKKHDKLYLKHQKQFNARWLQADALHRRAYRFNQDDTSFRLHTNMVSIKKELRDFITYNRRLLTNVDLKNSQPLFSLVLLSKGFYEGIDSDKSSVLGNVIALVSRYGLDNTCNIRLPQLSPLITQQMLEIVFTDEPVLIKSRGISQEDVCQDVKLYADLVQSGKLYEYISKELKTRRRVSKSRSEVKQIVYFILFDKVTGKHHRMMKEFFTELFPTVAEIFRVIKESGYENFAILLQTIESHVVLDHVTFSFNKIHRRSPLYTIHDSACTYSEKALELQRIFYEVVQEVLGLRCTVELDPWRSDLKQRH